MKKLSFLLLIVLCSSCGILQKPIAGLDQNWNDDVILQRVYAREQAKRDKEYSERIYTWKNDTLTISVAP